MHSSHLASLASLRVRGSILQQGLAPKQHEEVSNGSITASLLAKPGHLPLLDKPTGFSPSPEREFFFFSKVGACPAPLLPHLAGRSKGSPMAPPAGYHGLTFPPLGP